MASGLESGPENGGHDPLPQTTKIHVSRVSIPGMFIDVVQTNSERKQLTLKKVKILDKQALHPVNYLKLFNVLCFNIKDLDFEAFFICKSSSGFLYILTCLLSYT
jgi:hypothetical protein